MRVGAVDIGTNTTRLLVADLDGPAGNVLWREQRSVVTRLGHDVDKTGTLRADAIERTVAVLADYGIAALRWECARLRAVATSATRDANNRDEFLDRAEAALGVRPEVISGQVEAELSFAGATGGVDGPRPCLVIDPGGGSTEFVHGGETPDAVVSVDIGSVRLTERCLPDKPATREQIVAARRHVDELLAEEVATAPFATAVGVGGTYTALAAIRLELETYDSEAVHLTVLMLDELHELVEWLATLSLEAIEGIPSLDPARAPVILGGAVVAERALRHAGVDRITISERDILDGIARSLV